MTSLFSYIECKNHTTQEEREAISDASFNQLAQDQYDLISVVWMADALGVRMYQ